MSNYKTDRKNAISLRISDKELTLLDATVQRQPHSYFDKKSRTDVIVMALEVLEILQVKAKDLNQPTAAPDAFLKKMIEIVYPKTQSDENH